MANVEIVTGPFAVGRLSGSDLATAAIHPQLNRTIAPTKMQAFPLISALYHSGHRTLNLSAMSNSSRSSNIASMKIVAHRAK